MGAKQKLGCSTLLTCPSPEVAPRSEHTPNTVKDPSGQQGASPVFTSSSLGCSARVLFHTSVIPIPPCAQRAHCQECWAEGILAPEIQRKAQGPSLWPPRLGTATTSLDPADQDRLWRKMRNTHAAECPTWETSQRSSARPVHCLPCCWYSALPSS